MKYLKMFEEFVESNKPKVGDMVYIDVYGPYTLSYNDGHNHILRTIPFRPKIILDSFSSDTKYEIIFIEDNKATIYDDNNNVCNISLDKLFFEKIDDKYIKDCFLSSFEELYLNFEISNIFQINYNNYFTSFDIIMDIPLESESNFNNIFNNEFRPRLTEDNLKVSLWSRPNMNWHNTFCAKITVSILS